MVKYNLTDPEEGKSKKPKSKGIEKILNESRKGLINLKGNTKAMNLMAGCGHTEAVIDVGINICGIAVDKHDANKQQKEAKNDLMPAEKAFRDIFGALKSFLRIVALKDSGLLKELNLVGEEPQGKEEYEDYARTVVRQVSESYEITTELHERGFMLDQL